MAVLGSPGGPGDPGDPGGKSVPVDSSGQGGWVVQVVQPSIGSGDPRSPGGQNDQRWMICTQKIFCFHGVNHKTIEKS